MISTHVRQGLKSPKGNIETQRNSAMGPSATQVLSGPGKNLLDLSPLDLPLARHDWLGFVKVLAGIA